MSALVVAMSLMATTFLCSGCAAVALGAKHMVGSEVQSTRVARVLNWTTTGEVQRHGQTVRVFSMQQCTLHSQRADTVEKTYAQDRTVDGVDPRLYEGLAAALGLGLGGYLFFNADSVEDSSRKSAQEKGETSYTKASEAQTAGAVFAGLGLIGLSFVIVDTVRVSGSETSVETVTERGPLGAPLGECGERGLSQAQVVAVGESGATPLGATDARGMLELPLDKVSASASDGLAVTVEGVEVGRWPR